MIITSYGQDEDKIKKEVNEELDSLEILLKNFTTRPLVCLINEFFTQLYSCN